MQDSEHQEAISGGKEIVSQTDHITKTYSPRTYRRWKKYGISSATLGIIGFIASIFWGFEPLSFSLIITCAGLFAWCNALWEDKFTQVVLYARHLEKNIDFNSEID